jgi:hypothetical protein
MLLLALQIAAQPCRTVTQVTLPRRAHVQQNAQSSSLPSSTLLLWLLLLLVLVVVVVVDVVFVDVFLLLEVRIPT